KRRAQWVASLCLLKDFKTVAADYTDYAELRSPRDLRLLFEKAKLLRILQKRDVLLNFSIRSINCCSALEDFKRIVVAAKLFIDHPPRKEKIGVGYRGVLRSETI